MNMVEVKERPIDFGQLVGEAVEEVVQPYLEVAVSLTYDFVNDCETCKDSVERIKLMLSALVAVGSIKGFHFKALPEKVYLDTANREM